MGDDGQRVTYGRLGRLLDTLGEHRALAFLSPPRRRRISAALREIRRLGANRDADGLRSESELKSLRFNLSVDRLRLKEAAHRQKKFLTRLETTIPALLKQGTDTDTLLRKLEEYARPFSGDALDPDDKELPRRGSLRQYLQKALQRYNSEEIFFKGPPVLAGERTIKGLGLFLGELASNASNYGALRPLDEPQPRRDDEWKVTRRTRGWVDVEWTTKTSDEGTQVQLRWSERLDGGVLPKPTAQGGGSKLLGSELRKELGIVVTGGFREAGYEWMFEFLPGDLIPDLRRSRRSSIILVADDDIAVQDGVKMYYGAEEDGFECIEATSGKAALSTIRARGGELGMVLLDCDLGDGGSLRVADELVSRSIPFAFFTGGVMEPLGKHESAVRLLKPIDQVELSAMSEIMVSKGFS